MTSVLDVVDLWKEFSLPDEEDLLRELKTAGLSVLEVQEDQSKAEEDALKQKKQKARRGRQVKITNTHLKDIDLTIDYPLSKKKQQQQQQQPKSSC